MGLGCGSPARRVTHADPYQNLTDRLKPDRPSGFAPAPASNPARLASMTTRDHDMDEAVAGATERAFDHFRKLLMKEREHTAALQENVDANDFHMTLLKQTYENQHAETVERHKNTIKEMRADFNSEISVYRDVKNQAVANLQATIDELRSIV